MKRLLLLLILALISGLSHGQSFVFNGFDCTLNDETGTTPKQSRFEVIEEIGGGAYRIMFTGGMPVFADDKMPCITTSDAFGVETTDESNGQQVKKENAEALAYFTGTHLIITQISFGSYGPGQILGGTFVMSSFVFPRTYTFIFDFIPETMTFKLIRNMSLGGVISSVGNTETGVTMDGISQLSPFIYNPRSSIEYRME